MSEILNTHSDFDQPGVRGCLKYLLSHLQCPSLRHRFSLTHGSVYTLVFGQERGQGSSICHIQFVIDNGELIILKVWDS